MAYILLMVVYADLHTADLHVTEPDGGAGWTRNNIIKGMTCRMGLHLVIYKIK